MQVTPNYAYGNCMNSNYSTNFGSKFNTKQVTKTVEKVLPCTVATAAAVMASVAPMVNSLRDSSVPEMPTKENILSELQEPLVINGVNIFDPKEPSKIIDTALLDEVIDGKGIENEPFSPYSNILIAKYGSDKYNLSFNYPSKDAENGAEYTMKINKDGEIERISKAVDITYKDDKTFEKRTIVSPDSAQIWYYAGDDEFSIKYKTDENGNITVSKYHNELANDLPNLMNRSYDGEVNDSAMKKAFQKIYQ